MKLLNGYGHSRLTSAAPHKPQSNGKVENAVKVAQNIKRKARLAGTDPNLSLLDYENTPT